MTSRENMMAALAGVKHEWIPNFFCDVALCGATSLIFNTGPQEGGLDDFGVLWKTSSSAGGQACPITTNPVLDDISDWREEVRFPDIEAFDWQAMADRQLGRVDRNNTPVEFQIWSGPFERLTHLMGFENALCAMYEDPDEVLAFMTALADYYVSIVHKAAEYCRPDFITVLDDIATERGLFMSPDLFHDLIKPAHKRICGAAASHGITPIIHCCGLCQDAMDDFMDAGYKAWTCAQPSNDIDAMCKRTKGRFAVIGGFDTNGAPAREDATEEEVRAEVRRCIDTYGANDNYLFLGFRLFSSPDMSVFLEALKPIDDECKKYGRLN